MKRLIAILLTAATLLSLTACNKEQPPIQDEGHEQTAPAEDWQIDYAAIAELKTEEVIVGSWVAEVDMTDSFNAFLQKYTDDNKDFMPAETINELKKDMKVKKCTLIVNAEFKDGNMNIVTALKDRDALREEIRPGWNNIMNEILVAFGMTEEEGADMLTGLFDFEGFFNNVTKELEKELYAPYTLSDDALSFNGTAFGTVTLYSKERFILDITDAASDMYKSETYYNIEMNREWKLERR